MLWWEGVAHEETDGGNWVTFREYGHPNSARLIGTNRLCAIKKFIFLPVRRYKENAEGRRT